MPSSRSLTLRAHSPRYMARTARTVRFRVTGIFESGFYDFDDHYAFTALPTVQGLMSLSDVVNDIELRADDPNRAPEERRNRSGTCGW